MTIVSHGTRVGIRTDTPGLLERAQEILPPGWAPSSVTKVRRLYSLLVGKGLRPGDRRFHLLYMNAFLLARSPDLDDVLHRLESDVQLYVAERARGKVFVHARVVAWNGKAILLPGRTFSGKTTLVAGLLRAGATYYSDEYAVLDSKGRVHPFPKPLSVRDGSEGGRPTRYSPAELGAATGKRPIPVGLVAMTRYRPGGAWRPRRMSGGRAVLALLENTVPARRRPKAAFEALQRVVSQAPVLRGPRGEAGETVEVLLDRLA